MHHELCGILLLGTGTAESTYRPGEAWGSLIAVTFGARAALTGTT